MVSSRHECRMDQAAEGLSAPGIHRRGCAAHARQRECIARRRAGRADRGGTRRDGGEERMRMTRSERRSIDRCSRRRRAGRLCTSASRAAPFSFAEDILVEPDLAIISRRSLTKSRRALSVRRAEDVLLVVEIAVSSLAYDRDVKAQLYAQHGVAEFWLIDANERTTWVHTGPIRRQLAVDREAWPGGDIDDAGAAGPCRSSLASSTDYSAASLACPSRRLSDFTSSSAASAITVPGGKIASAPAFFSAS